MKDYNLSIGDEVYYHSFYNMQIFATVENIVCDYAFVRNKDGSKACLYLHRLTKI